MSSRTFSGPKPGVPGCKFSPVVYWSFTRLDMVHHFFLFRPTLCHSLPSPYQKVVHEFVRDYFTINSSLVSPHSRLRPLVNPPETSWAHTLLSPRHMSPNLFPVWDRYESSVSTVLNDFLTVLHSRYLSFLEPTPFFGLELDSEETKSRSGRFEVHRALSTYFEVKNSRPMKSCVTGVGMRADLSVVRKLSTFFFTIGSDVSSRY